MSAVDPLAWLLFAGAGLALGAAYFLLLYRTVTLHAAQAGAGSLVPLYLLRFALAGAAFWFIAQQGALPLLLALAGFLAARFAVQRFVGGI
ncbi:MAG: hypothetical protein Kow00114_23420 [Kiloniellaceae bacterium]